MELLFDSFGLPRPACTSNVFLRLEGTDLSRTAGRGRVWALTPIGRARSEAALSDLDIARLSAETIGTRGPFLGGIVHAILPPSLAAPELLPILRTFLDVHPFDRNVLGLTRFPDENDAEDPDPLTDVITAAREVCRLHDLEFHLASDRAMHDDLWAKVAAHMWASRYGSRLRETLRSVEQRG